MKICYASDYLPEYHEYWGGAERACYRSAKVLIERGHELNVLITKPNKMLKDIFNVYPVPVIEDFFPRRTKDLVKGLKIALLPYDFISCFFAPGVYKKLRPDILHVHSFPVLSFAIVNRAKELGIPIVMSVLDYWFICPLGFLWVIKDYLNYDGKPCDKYHGSHCYDCLTKFRNFDASQRMLLRVSLPFRKRVFDYFLNKIDGYIVLSEQNGEVLQKYGIKKEKIHVVHIPLTEEIGMEDSRKIERNSISFIGWLHPRKGAHIVIRAIADVVKEIPDAKLYVIGAKGKYDEEYEKGIHRFIKENSLEQNVFLLGKKPPEEAKQYLLKANVLTIPEQWETIAPNALTEGLVYGKAIIASRIGGILDIIRDNENGLLAEAGNPRDFAGKIILILKNDEIRFRLSQAARETGVNLFSEDVVYQELLAAYQSAIEHPNL